MEGKAKVYSKAGLDQLYRKTFSSFREAEMSKKRVIILDFTKNGMH